MDGMTVEYLRQWPVPNTQLVVKHYELPVSSE